MAKSFSMESLNAAQRKAVQTLQGPVLILAGAGTGKTRTVTCRIAHMVDRGISPKSILAVTFTNKAALEMRERVGQMVERKAARQIMVSTFHSLCVRILREDIGRLGYKTNFTILQRFRTKRPDPATDCAPRRHYGENHAQGCAFLHEPDEKQRSGP